MAMSQLSRTLEPEAMDTPQEAADYDAMDHDEVNRRFVDDLLPLLADAADDGGDGADESYVDILDLGTGTARIPIELCRRFANCRVMAVDLAIHMLELARYNVEVAGLRDRIVLDHVDAKQLPHRAGQFAAVISNSIVHHIPEPRLTLREAVRVTAAAGLIFFRDLMRPGTQDELRQLVQTYAGHESDQAREMFAASLHAALTLEEIRDLVSELGFARQSVQQTSDRHWTWIGQKTADDAG
jgi:ubiquinone/menaquinone biosynthesis C-methylase UbiE